MFGRKGSGFFIGKDVNVDLYHLHEATKKKIESLQLNYMSEYEQHKQIYLMLISSSIPYGITKEQQIIDEFALIIKDKEQHQGQDKEQHQGQNQEQNQEQNVDKKKENIYLSYRQYKEYVNKLENWLEIEKSLQYLPYFNSKVEPLLKEYKEEISKPVTKTFFSQSENKITKQTNSDSDEEPLKVGYVQVESYIEYLEFHFTTEIIEEIIESAKASSESFQIRSINRPKPLIGLRGNSRGLLGSELKLMQKESYRDDNNCCTGEDDTEDKSDVYNGLNYQDLGRVNLNQKYKYEKWCHFRDTIQQYQGLQNKFIVDKVFEDVIEMIKSHGLYYEKHSDPYYKITKEHIRRFLMETNNSKYYEDTQLIYSKITNKPCPNISKYESKLYEEFDMLVEVFLSMKSNRKNFLNSHYVLRQLLKRQGVRVTEEDLNCLKTPSRLREHDEIYQKCCERLGWNFTSLT
jgi:hypothetical protein